MRMVCACHYDPLVYSERGLTMLGSIGIEIPENTTTHLRPYFHGGLELGTIEHVSHEVLEGLGYTWDEAVQYWKMPNGRFVMGGIALLSGEVWCPAHWRSGIRE